MQRKEKMLSVQLSVADIETLMSLQEFLEEYVEVSGDDEQVLKYYELLDYICSLFLSKFNMM